MRRGMLGHFDSSLVRNCFCTNRWLSTQLDAKIASQLMVLELIESSA